MLEIKDICKSFNDKEVLRNLSLKIDSGRIFGLVGINGAGKSTLLRIVSGVYEADSGLVLFDGKNTRTDEEVRRDILYLSDDPYYTKASTIKSLKEYYQTFYNFDENEYYRYLNLFKLDPNKPLINFSKGMKRQAFLIFAFAIKPKLLILDEAFDGLDPVVRTTFKSLLIKLIDENSVTVIISSHNLRELEDICDSFGLLDHCEISTSGDIEESKEMISKYQLAFENGIPEEIYHDFNILHHKATGRVLTIVVKGNKDEIINRLKKYNPLMIDYLNVDFEELFIYEVESRGLNNE